MLKSLLIGSLSLIISSTIFAQTEGNYVLVIDNDSVGVDLDKNITFTTKSGEKLDIRLIQPDILTYSDKLVSFKYNKEYSVSNSQIEEGINQCMIVKATGNGFMVQEYHTLNPSGLNDLMANELTKESVSYGYKKKESKFKKKLKSGQTIEGVKMTLTYNDEKEIYVVASYGEKDRGIIVVTMMLSQDFKEDQDFINLFLNTLELK